MKKTIFVLTHDYWHHSDSIVPMIRKIFDEDYEVIHTTNPEDFYQYSPDLFLSFKDPIENDQIPTPVWCDEKWTRYCLEKAEKGMGMLLLHAALTDLPDGHEMLTKIIKSNFVMHPMPCEVSFVPIKEHPILSGIEEFVFPTAEEHYVMQFLEGAETALLANTVSQNGTQPGMWVHTYGIGRICCITPAHTMESLTCPQFIRLVQNALKWCLDGEMGYEH